MKVSQLIELLEEFDGDLEVRIMEQPSWPFEYSISGVTERRHVVDIDDDPDDPNVKKNCVFILEGTQLCYGSKEAWNQV